MKNIIFRLKMLKGDKGDSINYDDTELRTDINVLTHRMDVIDANFTQDESNNKIATQIETVTAAESAGGNMAIWHTFEIPENAVIIEASYCPIIQGWDPDTVPWKTKDVEMYIIDSTHVQVQVSPYNTSATAYLKISYAYSEASDLSELTDIRIGVDGTVYGSAGTAVRTQISDLQSCFDDLDDGYYHISNFVANQYCNVYQNGVFANYNGFSRTDYIPLDNLNKLYIITERASQYNGFYASDKSYITYIQLAVGLNAIAIPQNAKYVVLSNTTSSMLTTKIINADRSALISNRLINNKYILIGDSYCQGYSPDGNTTGWGERLKTLMNLNDNNCVIKCLGGTGFYRAYDGKTFSTLLDEAGAEYTDKKEVTHVVICGGYNDQFETTSNVYNAILSMHNKIRTEYPNAKLYIGMIGASNDSTAKSRLQNVLYSYQYGSAGDIVAYLSNVEYALAEANLASDGAHPNDAGQHQISIAIKQALDMGSAYIPHRFYNQIKTS